MNVKWKWRVDSESEILSDHFPLLIKVTEKGGNETDKIFAGRKGWKWNTFNEEYFNEALSVGLWPTWREEDPAETQAEKLTEIIIDE